MFDSFNAERTAHRAAGAISGDQQSRVQGLFSGSAFDANRTVSDIAGFNPVEARRPIASQRRNLLQARFKCIAEIPGDDDPAEFLPLVLARIELDAPEIPRAADMDTLDPPGRIAKQLHHAQRAQCIDSGLGKTEVAFIEHRWQGPGRAGLEQANIQPCRIECNGQACAHQSAADYQDVMAARRHGVNARHCAMLTAPLFTDRTRIMNRPQLFANTTLSAAGPLTLAVLIFIAALSRLLPHPPNFSPIEAVALFGGAYFVKRHWALLVPLVAMFLSDMVLGVLNGGIYWGYFASAGYLLVYACIALSTLLGFGLRGKVGASGVLSYSLAGSLLFFVVTNFGAWLSDPAYPKTLAGLGAAYVAGVPFFQWTVLGTLFYAALLFGGFELLRSRVPALRAQTA